MGREKRERAAFWRVNLAAAPLAEEDVGSGVTRPVDSKHLTKSPLKLELSLFLM